jgi:integrase
MVKPFVLLYFTGIRPGELLRIAGREKELINLKTRTLTVPANVSKTRHDRQVLLPNNLLQWLDAFRGPVIPVNFDNLSKKVRKHFNLSHDEARHSFISFHVALHRSIGDAALQAGNSESIVKRHYLNLHTREEGGEFFQIVPDIGLRRAGIAPTADSGESFLKAI